nr:WGR domain-containing protein [Acuticoccus yangtzensis]
MQLDPLMQLDLFPTDMRLRCIDPARGMWRFYSLSIQPTLFGEWTLVREAGRLGHAGRVQTERYSSAGQAIDALYAAAQDKRRRGYRG